MTKPILYFLSFFFLGISYSQNGFNASIDLTESENLINTTNLYLKNGFLVNLNQDKTSKLITKAIPIPILEEEQPFIALNVALPELPIYGDGELQILFRTKNSKKWSSWTSLTKDAHQSDYFSIRMSQEFLPAESKKIQFQIKTTKYLWVRLSSINYRLYFPGISNDKIESALANELFPVKDINCSCPIPNVQLRTDWCPSGNCPKDPTPSPTTVSHLVVHHSAGSNISPDWAATVRSIWDFHVNSNGWDDVGYNYLIDPNGVVYEGRGSNVSGAHFSCMNPNTMGVCLLGNYSTATPSNAMINALTEIMAWKACEIDQDPRDTSFFSTGSVDLINLCGHRDGNNIPASCTVTECPGNNVYSIMNTIRANVFNYTQNCSLSPSYSDIVIISLDAEPDTLRVNENIQLNLVFKNSGDVDINENLSISYRIDGSEVGTDTFSNLAVNQSISKPINHQFSSIGGHQYCAYIDAANNELNANNNSFCINLNVLEEKDTAVTGINNGLLASYQIVPNPSNKFIEVEGFVKGQEVHIYSAIGKRIISSKQARINISDLPKGVYSVALVGSSNHVILSNIRFVKN